MTSFEEQLANRMNCATADIKAELSTLANDFRTEVHQVIQQESHHENIRSICCSRVDVALLSLAEMLVSELSHP